MDVRGIGPKRARVLCQALGVRSLLGAQMLGRGALIGVTYDSHDQRVEIMLGDAHRPRRHLIHSIARVESIALTTEKRSGSEALELRHGSGHTLVMVGS